MKITIIGSGNMGGAMARGFVRAGKNLHITVTAKTRQTLDNLQKDFPELTASLDNRSAVKDTDVIIIAVKPWLIEKVVEEIRPEVNLSKQTVISVAANVFTADLATMFCAQGRTAENTAVNIFYAMPNIAAEFGESMTFLAPHPAASPVTVEKTVSLLALLGKVKVVEGRLVASGMMMAGCGIAYAMRYIRAMMEGGTELGFYPADAQQIVQQTLRGAVTLLENTGLHPEAAIDKVTTPGGITIKGLNELDHAGFNSAVVRALKAGMK